MNPAPPDAPALCLPSPPHNSDPSKVAQQILDTRGLSVVLEELSRPVIHTIPPALQPILARLCLEALDTPLTFTAIAAPATAAIPPSPSDLSITAMTASLRIPLLKTGCSPLDNLLGGGLPAGPGTILELAGPAGAGKTQTALQLALMAAAPPSHGGLSSAAVLACTEGPPPIARLRAVDAALCARFGLPAHALARGVVVERVRSADELLRWARGRLPHVLRAARARVVVVDSVAAVYRGEFADARARAPHMARMAAALKAAAAGVGGVCVCVNQVSQQVEGAGSGGGGVVPALGAAWGNCVDTRVFLRRGAAGARFATVLHSSYLGRTEGKGAAYRITEDGVVAE